MQKHYLLSENYTLSCDFVLLIQAKKEGHGAFKDVKKCGLKDLYKHFVPDGPSSGK